MNKPFVFVGSGFGYLWLLIWTTVVSIITVGLFFPWAYSAQQRWICANTYVEGRRLRFDGTGLGFFFSMAGHYASDGCYFWHLCSLGLLPV